jgi:hypothetical protein
MGLDIHGAALVAMARQKGMPMDRVVTLGRQDSLLTNSWCRHLESRYGVTAGLPDAQTERYGEAFFHHLGAVQVDSLDRSAYQGSTLCRDLNDPPPETSAAGYDLVYDGGTLEHVFHFPNAIANCMSMVKLGGHFMASLPANDWLGHGFYQFAPELFFRVFCPANGFEIERIFLVEGAPSGRLYRVLDPAQTGVRGLMRSPRELSVLVWAKKISEAKPFTAWPQQSDYASRWAAGAEAPAPAAAAVSHQSLSAMRRVRRFLGKMVPQAVWDHLAWRRHLATARQGFEEVQHLQ